MWTVDSWTTIFTLIKDEVVQIYLFVQQFENLNNVRLQHKFNTLDYVGLQHPKQCKTLTQLQRPK